MHVDRAMLRGGHEPGSRVIWNARLWPPLECGEEGVLREIFSQSNVADDSRQTSDEPRRLDPPDGIDRLVSIRHYRFANAGASYISRTSLSPSPTTWRKRLV